MPWYSITFIGSLTWFKDYDFDCPNWQLRASLHIYCDPQAMLWVMSPSAAFVLPLIYGCVAGLFMGSPAFPTHVTVFSATRSYVTKTTQLKKQKEWHRKKDQLAVISNTQISGKKIQNINPLLPEFFFSWFFGTYPKIGSFRLPTHSPDALRKFFWWSILKLKSKFCINVPCMAR